MLRITPTGQAIPAGPAGESAYQLWRDAGHTGTLQDFLASLIGPPGPPGPQGQAVAGLPGGPGPAGPAPWAAPVAWATGAAYSATPPASVVTYAGSSYVCTTAHFAGAAFDATKWTLLALKGDTGSTGATGQPGATGGTGATGSTGPAGPLPWLVPPTPWIASTKYYSAAPANCVTYGGSCYVCSTAHTSGSTFDPSMWVQITPAGTVPAYGQCELVYASSTNLVLKPVGGGLITVGGLPYQIPAGGIGLAPTGAVSGSRYYIYCNWNGSSLVLYFSTNGYTLLPNGHPVNAANANHTLVGQAVAVAGPAWSFTPAAQLVRTWFNDPGILTASVAGSQFNGNSNNSWSNSGTGTPVSFILWAGEILTADFTSTILGSGTAASNFATAFSLDGSVVTDRGVALSTSSTAAYGSVAITATWTGLAEQYHTINVTGQCVSNNGTVLYYVTISGSSYPTLRLRSVRVQ